MPPLTLQVLAEQVQGQIFGDPNLLIRGVAELAEALPGELAPLLDSARETELAVCRASAILAGRPREGLNQAQLICPDPRRALGLLLDIFAEEASTVHAGVDPRAAVDASARVDASAWVGPFTYVGPRASIGPRSRIEPFSYVAPGVAVGTECHVGPGATLLVGSYVGDRVMVGPGSVVGQGGFGFWRDPEGWHLIRSQN